MWPFLNQNRKVEYAVLNEKLSEAYDTILALNDQSTKAFQVYLNTLTFYTNVMAALILQYGEEITVAPEMLKTVLDQKLQLQIIAKEDGGQLLRLAQKKEENNEK